MIGDVFVCEAKNTLHSLNKTQSATFTSDTSNKVSQKQTLSRLFIFKQFNVSAYYPGLVVRGLNRMIFPLVEALNSRHKIPKYIIVIPDKDLITEFTPEKFDTSMVMGSTIHQIVKKLDHYIERREQDIEEKKDGAIAPPDFPTFIWVCMLKRPYIVGGDAIFSLRGKFTSAIEEQIKHGKDSRHRLMSIDVHLDEFDRQGNLTSAGKADFWKEVNCAVKKFDDGEIKLLPRGLNNKDTTQLAASTSASIITKTKTTESTTEIKNKKKPASSTFLQRIAEQFRKNDHRHSPKARKRLWSPKTKNNHYYPQHKRSHHRSSKEKDGRHHHHGSQRTSRSHSRSHESRRRSHHHHH